MFKSFKGFILCPLLRSCTVFFLQCKNSATKYFILQNNSISEASFNSLKYAKILRRGVVSALPNSKLENHPLSDGSNCVFNVLANMAYNKILQFHYLIVFPVADCDAGNSVSFPKSFRREHVPS